MDYYFLNNSLVPEDPLSPFSVLSPYNLYWNFFWNSSWYL